MDKPELIDDELAAMEAGMAAARNHKQQIPDGVLHRVIGAARAALGGDRTRRQYGPTRAPNTSDSRAARRSMRSDEPPDRKRLNHARLGRAKPAGARQRAHQAEVRGILLGIKLTAVLRECPELKFVAGVPKLKTVWHLANASNEVIQAIPGFGPARRKKVHAYLTAKNVPVKWVA